MYQHFFAFYCAIQIIFISTAASDAQIVVDDAQLSKNEILAEVPMVGYGAFPKGGFVSLDPKKEHWALDGTVLYEAAGADLDFQIEVGKSKDEIKSLPLQDLLSLYKKTSKPIGHAQCSADMKDINVSTDCTVWHSVAVNVNSGPRFQDSKLDPQIVRRAFSAGVFDKASISTLPVMGHGGVPAVGVTVDTTFAKRASNLYLSADKFSSGGQDPSTAFDFAKAKVTFRDTSVNKVTEVLLTTVAIGIPLILTADDKKLVLPRTIANAYDVYWLQLALNPKTDLRGKVDELSFFVSLKTQDSEAFELVPLRYGQNREVKEVTKVPAAEIKAGEFGVSVGEVYSLEVSYKTLKPTIVGTGIQDSEFGWTLSDDMLDMSAKRLIAIIGVPKKSSKLDLEMIVTARTNPNFWRSLQGNIASTGPVKYSGKLGR
jgi:hypothetical protein